MPVPLAAVGAGFTVNFSGLGGFWKNNHALGTEAGGFGSGQKLQGLGEEGDRMTAATLQLAVSPLIWSAPGTSNDR